MSKSTFKTNPVRLKELLQHCEQGKIQLPDFQRSWVWAEDRILSLIASISQAFPIGALMTLSSKAGSTDVFARRPVQGCPASAAHMIPDELLLDGQQRMTSLFQSCLRQDVVETITPKRKLVKRWFYIDMPKALQADSDRDDAIFSVPEDRRLKENFDKDIKLDLSSAELEYEQFSSIGSSIGTTGAKASRTIGSPRGRSKSGSFSDGSRTRYWRILTATTCRSLPWRMTRLMRPFAWCLKK